MRTSNLQAAGGRIQEALEELQIAWRATRDHWQDQQAVHFEETYMKRISEEFAAAFPAIHQMAQALGDADRDCSE